MTSRRSWLIVVSTVLLFTSVAVSVLGLGSRTPEHPLAPRALQAADLKGEGAERIHRQSISGREALPGPLGAHNLPLQATGFASGYRVAAPCAVRLSGGQQGMMYVMNIVYQFQDESQAAEAFEQQLEFYEDSKLPEDVGVVALSHDASLASQIGLQGRAYAVRYPSEGIHWESRYFLGMKADTLVLLMVDGLPDPAAERLFDALAARVVQLQE
jgi:hypothetical protein